MRGAAVVLLTAAAVCVAQRAYSGVFVRAHAIPVSDYENRQACEADHGRWADDGCWFDVQDRVEVREDDAHRGAFLVSVATVGANAHECSFEGSGKLEHDTLVVRSPEDPACTVTVSYAGADTVSVSNNGSCQYFCGMRASLDISQAVRAR